MVARLDDSLLATLPVFAELSTEQVREVVSLATFQHWDEGTHIFHAGDPAERFFLLLDGAVRPIRITADGEQLVPLHIPPGQFFGIAVAMGRETYPASAVAAKDCVGLAWPSRLWPQFVARYGSVATKAWREIGVRLQEVQERVAELSTRDVEQRVAAALLRMVNQFGHRVEDGIDITFPITRATIAEMTGTTLHTVSRLLSGWEKDGIVASTRKHVTITDPHRLGLICGETP
jgi:CRP/FNR family transcriptional regulator, nitrogen oxide reductase regulator